jgi:hypothetical protein
VIVIAQAMQLRRDISDKGARRGVGAIGMSWASKTYRTAIRKCLRETSGAFGVSQFTNPSARPTTTAAAIP